SSRRRHTRSYGDWSSDVCSSDLTYGATVQRALTAANAVAENGISVEVIDLRTLSPWDRDAVFDSVKKNSRVIVAYEDSLSWGFRSEERRVGKECRSRWER